MAYYFTGSASTGDGVYFLPKYDMMKNMSMHMGQYFYFSTTVKHFLFEDVNLHGAAGVVATCLIMFGFTVMLEGTKSLLFYLNQRKGQNPLTYGQTDTSIQTQRILFHVGGYLLHSINLLLGYLLMLAIMSYDAYILIAVLLGSGVGYFVFGAINQRNRARFGALKASVYKRYDSQAVLTANSEPSLGSGTIYSDSAEPTEHDCEPVCDSKPYGRNQIPMVETCTRFLW